MKALKKVRIILGVLGFAVATGLLFGRVSRPSARIECRNAASKSNPWPAITGSCRSHRSSQRLPRN